MAPAAGTAARGSHVGFWAAGAAAGSPEPRWDMELARWTLHRGRCWREMRSCRVQHFSFDMSICCSPGQKMMFCPLRGSWTRLTTEVRYAQTLRRVVTVKPHQPLAGKTWVFVLQLVC